MKKIQQILVVEFKNFCLNAAHFQTSIPGGNKFGTWKIYFNFAKWNYFKLDGDF